MTAYEDSETRRANIAFIKRSMETPLLTREHEYALARAWRDESNDAALHELINAYNRLVVSTAGRFKNYGLPVGDLIQEGVVGLLHAANRFEPDRDVRFSTYASWWIRSAMQTSSCVTGRSSAPGPPPRRSHCSSTCAACARKSKSPRVSS